MYRPLVTSYNYDTPLDEAGYPTAKYHALREVIARHRDVPDPAPPPAPEFAVPLRHAVWLLDDRSQSGR